MRIFTLLLLLIFLLGRSAESLDFRYENLGLSVWGIETGRFWQFLTYGLLHGGAYHMVMNAIPLYFLGKYVQQRIGIGFTLVLLGASCVGGGVIHLLFSLFQEQPDQAVLIGVSGGVMGLLLFITTGEPYQYVWKIPIRFRHLGTGFMVSSLVLALMVPSMSIPLLSDCGVTLSGWFGESLFVAAHACHFGGGLAGVVMARWHIKRIGRSKD